MDKKAAFLMFTNLSNGSGTEQVVLQYCRNKPPDWQVTVFQKEDSSDAADRVNSRFRPDNVSFSTFRDYQEKFSFLTKFRTGNFILLFIIYPILFLIAKRLPAYRSLRDKLRSFDIVYVLGNYYSALVPKGPIVIGSTHNWNPMKVRESGILYGLLTLLVSKHILWRRIDAYHLFPKLAWVGDKLNSYFVLSNGIDKEFLEPGVHISRDSSARFAFVGRLEDCKGVRRVIEAFSHLPDSKRCELSIIGTGPLSGKLPALPKIKFHGYINNNLLPKLLSQSNCLVLPSDCDTFGLVVLEAIACGLYVIVSDTLEGTFDDFERLGVLEYCSNNVSEIEERMGHFTPSSLNNSGFIEAKRILEDRYSWSSIVPILFTEFEKLITAK